MAQIIFCIGGHILFDAARVANGERKTRGPGRPSSARAHIVMRSHHSHLSSMLAGLSGHFGRVFGERESRLYGDAGKTRRGAWTTHSATEMQLHVW